MHGRTSSTTRTSPISSIWCRQEGTRWKRAQERCLVDSHLIKAKPRHAYIKLLGADINWFSPATADKTVFGGKCKAMLDRWCLHVPGMVLLRWSSRES